MDKEKGEMPLKKNKILLYKEAERPSVSSNFYLKAEQRAELDLSPLMQSSYHWHDYFEMEFICRGEATHILNGEAERVKRGSIYLLTPADFHTVYQEDGDRSLCYYNINFNEYALAPELIMLLTEYGERMSVTLCEADCRMLETEFSTLMREYSADKPLKEKMLKNIFEKIFIIFWRNIMETSVPHKNSHLHMDSNIRYIVNYLRIHFRESVSLGDIAKMVHLTPNYVGELFKKETGLSFTDYVSKLRLSYATNLLLSSDMSIANISTQSGFHAASYFIKSFKAKTGMTPLEYRNKENERSLNKEETEKYNAK